MEKVVRAQVGRVGEFEATAPTETKGEILGHIFIVELSVDDDGTTAKTIRISGVNVQIVNGLDRTETANGVGNLLVGYAETQHASRPLARTGSHNVIVGAGHTFSSFGGFVAGENHQISGEYSSVTGGASNVASGRRSSVSLPVRS